MTITTKAFRIALIAAALGAAGTGDADARARRVVILDFDGPRTLADTGRSAVVSVLGAQYDVVATKRWEQARAAASKSAHGPQSWKKAAKQAGVDAVIEGWVQDEGRHKVLTIAVRDAATGNEIDQISVKLVKTGLTDAASASLRTGLDEVLDWVEGTTDPSGKGLPQVTGKEARVMIGAKNRLGDEAAHAEAEADDRTRHRVKDDAHDDAGEPPRRRDDPGEPPRRRDDRDDRDRPSERLPERAPAPTAEPTDQTERRAPPAVATAPEAKDTLELIDIFGPKSVEVSDVTGTSPMHEPRPTPRFQIGGGGYYGARSFVPDADSDNVQDFSARSAGFQLAAAVYPFPTRKLDGELSGIGFSFNLYHSAGAVVGADTDDTVGDYAITQYGFEGALHYRQPLGIVSLDGELGYGADSYNLASDFPLEVPDAQYGHLHAGVHLDLHVTERASIGFGGKYLYVLDNGDVSSLDWYGPGTAAGFALDANFVIPLPRRLYVRGELGYRRITTEFDGAGVITEEENVFGAADATMNGQVNLGILF